MSDTLPPHGLQHCQASLSITNSRSLLKFMSIKSVIQSNHLILCHPLLLLPSIFLSIRVFSNESILLIRWPKYWSFSFSISPSDEYSGLISFRIDWLDLLAVQGTLKSLLQHHSSKASILWHSAFFTVQLSHHYSPTLMFSPTLTFKFTWIFFNKFEFYLILFPMIFTLFSLFYFSEELQKKLGKLSLITFYSIKMTAFLIFLTFHDFLPICDLLVHSFVCPLFLLQGFCLFMDFSYIKFCPFLFSCFLSFLHSFFFLHSILPLSRNIGFSYLPLTCHRFFTSFVR